MSDHDPLKRVFAERRDAADTVDLDAGLAGVHRRNSITHRAARVVAPMAVVIAAVIGVVWWAQGDGEGTDGFQTTTTVPTDPTEAPPSTILDDPAPQPASFIYTDGSDAVVTPQATLTFGPEVEGPITDAIDDLAGGLVIETADAIWHRPAGQSQPVKLVDEQPGGELNLIDVGVDSRDAATKVVYTHVATETQVLQLLAIDGNPSEPEVIRELVDGTYVNGGFADGSLVLAHLSDVGVGFQTMALVESESAESIGDGSSPYGAIDVGDSGDVVWVDGESVSGIDIERTWAIADLPVNGRSTVDVWGEWAAIATPNPQRTLVTLIELDDLSTFTSELPGDITSYRLARSEIDLGVPTPGTVAPPTTALDNPVPAGEYRVVGVAADDMLNVRSGPGTQFSVEGGVENGGIVTATGVGRELPDGSIWMELAWPENQIVWANAAFLELISEGGEEFQCEGDESPEPGTTVVVGQDTGGSEVLGISETSFGHCVRTVIETPGVQSVTVADDGNSLIVRFPDSVTEVAVGATVDTGSAYVLRDGDFRPYAEIVTGPLVRFGATFDPDAGQLVIDWAWATDTGSPAPVPPFADAGIVIRDTGLEYRDDGNWIFTDRPTSFTGWARPFEANIGLEVLDNRGQPHEEVQWRSGEGEVFGSSTYTMTTDWATAWGVFSFEILDITPGDYTLRMTGDGGSDTPRYLEIPFTVEP